MTEKTADELRKEEIDLINEFNDLAFKAGLKVAGRPVSELRRLVQEAFDSGKLTRQIDYREIHGDDWVLLEQRTPGSHGPTYGSPSSSSTPLPGSGSQPSTTGTSSLWPPPFDPFDTQSGYGEIDEEDLDWGTFED